MKKKIILFSAIIWALIASCKKDGEDRLVPNPPVIIPPTVPSPSHSNDVLSFTFALNWNASPYFGGPYEDSLIYVMMNFPASIKVDSSTIKKVWFVTAVGDSAIISSRDIGYLPASSFIAGFWFINSGPHQIGIWWDQLMPGARPTYQYAYAEIYK